MLLFIWTLFHVGWFHQIYWKVTRSWKIFFLLALLGWLVFKVNKASLFLWVEEAERNNLVLSLIPKQFLYFSTRFNLPEQYIHFFNNTIIIQLDTWICATTQVKYPFVSPVVDKCSSWGVLQIPFHHQEVCIPILNLVSKYCSILRTN